MPTLQKAKIEWVDARCKLCGIRLTGFEFVEFDSHCLECHRDKENGLKTSNQMNKTRRE